MKIRIILIFIMGTAIYLFAQSGGQGRAGNNVLKGSVVDEMLNVPVEYANIILNEQGTNTQITGTTTNSDGMFILKDIKPGMYHLKVKFIGYHEKSIDSLYVSPQRSVVDLGTINLDQAILMLEGIQVEAEKAAVEYQIDRKVINVDQQITASSGSAVDVLENVPSITVDIEGNVQLRGSSSFTVLIDNRPTVMEASDVLQQVPASSIENIEIITNPSAKYEPDGVTGIINIITKKNSMYGFSGIVNTNSGVNNRYGGDVKLEFRQDKINSFVGINYNNRNFPGERISENITTVNDTSYYRYSNGSNEFNRMSFGLQAGIDYAITDQDNFKVEFDYGNREMERGSDLNYDEWHNQITTHDYYSSNTMWGRSGPRYSASMDYVHRFADKGHELSAMLNYSKSDGDELSVNENQNSTGQIMYGRKSLEKGPGLRTDFKIDYTNPFGENSKFETGYHARFSRSEEENELHEYDAVLADYMFLPEFSYLTNYRRDIHAVYTMYAGTIAGLGFQGGVRGEYTDRMIELDGPSEKFVVDRWDYFPSAHLSYEFNGGHQMMTSYTRRIDRPRGYYFEPFLTWMDAYNVRSGNPAIKPEYIDSWELGYQKHLGKNLFSVESYYRITHDRVERVRSVYTDNVILHSVENVGRDYALGAEFMLNWDLISNWNINFMGNAYDYRIEGQLYGENFSRNSFNWNTRLNNTYKVSDNSRVQFNLRYNSPSVSSQGRREGYFSTSLAYRQDLLNKRLSLTLQVRDLFGTEKWESYSEGAGFYNYSRFDRDTPNITMTMSYKLNNYKSRRDGGGMNGGDFGSGDMDSGY